MAFDKHCVYKTLKRYLEINNNLLINEELLFNFYGGHTLKYTKTEEGSIPSYNVLGNNIDNLHLYENTGIKTNIISENYQNAISTTFNILNSGKTQIVIANCYYLPFDKKNFKNNFDNHILHIEKYSKENATFFVSDNKYYKIPISKKDLLIARQNLVGYKNFYRYMNVIIDNNHLVNQNDFDIINKKIISKNAKEMLDYSIDEFQKLSLEFEKVNSLPEPFRKISFYYLARSFKHPNAPSYTRYLLSFNFKDDISQMLKLLSEYWNQLANNLVRIAENNIELDKLLELFSEIMLLEKKVNIRILKEV